MFFRRKTRKTKQVYVLTVGDYMDACRLARAKGKQAGDSIVEEVE